MAGTIRGSDAGSDRRHDTELEQHADGNEHDEGRGTIDFGGREGFVDGRTVCEFLSISSRTLSRWLVEHDGFPRYRVGGGWRFLLSEIARWAKQNRGHHEKKRGRR